MLAQRAQGKELNVVCLDCEGMCSEERLESEDQMLALMVTALSSFTVYRTDSTSDRHLRDMLQSFSRGASKVTDICKDSSRQARCLTLYSGSKRCP